MAIVVAVLLALYVLPRPWGVAAVAAAVVYEVATTWIGWRWSRRQRIAVGPAALLGEPAEVVEPCGPDGTVRIRGELWAARCAVHAERGARVRVRAVDGLVLEVEREPGG